MAYTRQQAWDLLTQYNKGEFHLKHACIVADVMRWYAEQLGYGEEADFWEIVGLLHDLDFELYPDEHCIKSQQIMREHGLDERLIRATASHGYGLHFDGLPEPQHEMERCSSPLTSLQASSARLRSCARAKVSAILRSNPSRKNTKTRSLPPAARARSLSAALQCSAGISIRSSSGRSLPCAQAVMSTDPSTSFFTGHRLPAERKVLL